MENKPKITSHTSFTFSKEERLCSKKVIDRLFAEGSSFIAYPLKVVFLPAKLNTAFPAQAGFSVSKKNFKRAVKRNRIKRLMREAYRLHKQQLYQLLAEQQLAMFFIYIGKEMPEYVPVENAIKKAFLTIQKKLEESPKIS